MSTVVPFYLKVLRSDFEEKLKRNSGYSLRAYSKFLGIQAPSLSGVLNGNRKVPKKKIEEVTKKLNLSPSEKSLFIQTNLSKNASVPIHSLDFVLDDEMHFKVIAEWEYYAIMSLVQTKDFKYEEKWIAGRLGITNYRARACIENLLQLNLVVEKDSTLLLTNKGLTTTHDVASAALKRARLQDLELARQSIDKVSVENRDLSSVTMTLKKNDIPKFKEKIKEFRREFMKDAESKTGDEVYKLSIQLIPLTNITGEEK